MGHDVHFKYAVASKSGKLLGSPLSQIQLDGLETGVMVKREQAIQVPGDKGIQVFQVRGVKLDLRVHYKPGGTIQGKVYSQGF